MKKQRFRLTLNWLLLISLILTACGGGKAPTLPIPQLTAPTTTAPAPTTAPQAAFPPTLIETDPPINSAIGHLSPITFYFNEAMNKQSVESAFKGLPQGSFTWKDDSTVVFAPTQPYTSNATLKFSINNSVQSATGFALGNALELVYPVSDFLRPTNILPKANATDVNVNAAVAVSFNQPVVPFGADSGSLPTAFTLVPSAPGKGEWINTSTYVFTADPALAGGTEYAVSLNADLKSVTGVGFEGTEGNAWKFVTAKPQVVSVSPAQAQFLPLDPQIKVTFNQSMDPLTTEPSFVFNGTNGAITGKITWNDDNSELTFTPDRLLDRNVGYILNVGTGAKSRGGMPLSVPFAADLKTYPDFAVDKTSTDFSSVTFYFTAPLPKGNYEKMITANPPVDLNANLSDDGLSLVVYGNFLPDTDYTLTVSDALKDQWGEALGTAYVANIHTPPAPPALTIRNYTSNISFVRPDEPVLYATAVNIQDVNVTVAPLGLPDFFNLAESYENQQAFAPANAVTIAQNILPSKQNADLKLKLAQASNQLPTGLYYVSPSSPQLTNKQTFFVASSQVNLTFKLGATEALVWAVDLPSQTPVANAPVVIYDDKGAQLGAGTTDSNGIWKGAIGDREQYSQAYAVVGQPGDETFGFAVSNWNFGIQAYDFGYAQNIQKPHTQIYMYTDRPIYRAGQTVYFKGVAREAFNGRYQLPSITTIPVTLNDVNGVQLANLNLQLSPYGTFNGQYELPAEAVPGYYTFQNPALNFYQSFQVAEYRKPEIDLGVKFNAPEIQSGNGAKATINANYFFGAPASNVDVKWAFYVRSDHFDLLNYQTGLFDESWLDVFRTPNFNVLGKLVQEGTGQTSGQGTLSIDLPAIPESDAKQIVTLEVTAQDESGLPVSTRAELPVHPADFYIGLHPDQWFGVAKSPLGFDVFTSDWTGKESGGKTLVAEFKGVRWEKQTDANGYPTYTPVYTPVSSSNLATGPDGKARLSFTPPTPGTYILDVSGAATSGSGQAHSQTLIWVGGVESAAWADLPEQRLQLTADKDSYKVGDTAKVFIPNPFATNSLALVTVERGIVSQADVITVSGSGKEYDLPLSEDDAPNVYVSVTMLGQGNDFRTGLVNIPVAPDAEKLNVQVTANPPEAGPRDSVTFDVQVTDNQGQPVEGEFSVAVVDKAVLALADPNSEDIVPAFYKNQPLGIGTSVSLLTYTGRVSPQPGGLGGGGGGDVTVVRELFPDTAYWNPSLITGADGHGQVNLTLPDSLTTWHVDVRGLTTDTKVGQAETELVATKPLLIRPVTPRFLVSGDHVLMAAIINNNTTNDVQAAVNLQSDGFVLDDPGKATLNINIPANGRYRAEWWGTAGQTQTADLVFSVTTNSTPALQDSARPVWGKLPILQYTAPQAFVTGGVLNGAASQQEVIALPRTYSPTSGGLDVELSPSLAGNLLSALAAMPDPEGSPDAESLVSYLLPNIEVYRALNGAGLKDDDLSARVTSSLNASVSNLLSLQNSDGGWGWWHVAQNPDGTGGSQSDPYISAYIFFALQKAQLAGATVSDDVFTHASAYLQKAQPAIDQSTTGEILDTIAFIQYTLSQVDLADAKIVNTLYDARNRMSPVGLAWTAAALDKLNKADPRAKDLISNLETTAIVTSASAHWETPQTGLITRGSTIYTTSIVAYVLAQLDPANQVLLSAVRFLAAHRNASGFWNQGHDNAWAILALNAAMVGIGDMRSDFSFNASLNGNPLTSGDVAGIQTKPLTANVPLNILAANPSNVLTIQRKDGLGRLYYNAILRISRPVQDVKPIDEGMRIDRSFCAYAPSGSKSTDCAPLSSLQLASNQPITAQLTLVLPHDSYYVQVEDYIPAGMEILNRNLKTSQQGVDTTQVQTPQFDDKHPFANGWGWWLFNDPQIRDESILFSANFLPAGTYVLTYTLVPLQAGEYRVLPAHAWESFFPEVQGTSAGAVFEIKP